MKVCLQCRREFESSSWNCPDCKLAPESDNGIPLFAPDLSNMIEGFRPEIFTRLQALEEKNFWFKVRNKLIIWAIREYFPNAKNFLEIGCGTGFVITGVESTFPQMSCAGSELHSAGLNFAKSRVGRTNLYQMDARNIPFCNEFDIVSAFDVLEHIKEDEEVIAQMYRTVRPGGGIILTVPQHPSLWSSTDEVACHERRYTSSELVKKVSAAGFEVSRKSSFVSFLLPFMALSRWKEKVLESRPNAGAELQIPGALNSLFESVLSLELKIIQFGGNFPVGGSLFLVAHKS